MFTSNGLGERAAMKGEGQGVYGTQLDLGVCWTSLKGYRILDMANNPSEHTNYTYLPELELDEARKHNKYLPTSNAVHEDLHFSHHNRTDDNTNVLTLLFSYRTERETRETWSWRGHEGSNCVVCDKLPRTLFRKRAYVKIATFEIGSDQACQLQF